MKTLLILTTLLLATFAAAQPQWRFHLAFEDATGARDTMWFLYDTTATIQAIGFVDTHLGEGAADIDADLFYVWKYNGLFDSTKTVAEPYTQFPHGIMTIQGENYTFPITLRWDTMLFHAPYLPNTPTSYLRYPRLCSYYFAMTGTDTWPGSACYSMLLSDSLVIDGPYEGWLFVGLVMHFSYDSPITTHVEEYPLPNLGVAPNPARERVALSAPEPLEEVLVVDALGRAVLATHGMGGTRVDVDVSSLPAGSYFVHARGREQMYRGKVVVER